MPPLKKQAHGRFIEMTGRRFGRLKVLRLAEQRIGRDLGWVCACDCGATLNVRGAFLRRGVTKSCGCYHRDRLKTDSLKHGHTIGHKISPEFVAWCSMKQRCLDSNCKSYPRYGGRGIRVALEWVNDFEAFYRAVGPRPSPKHTLDRISVNGHYEPGNVQWATQKQQQRNRTNNRLITANGVTKCQSQWAAELGVPDGVIHKRLKRGWPPERAVSEPLLNAWQRKGGRAG